MGMKFSNQTIMRRPMRRLGAFALIVVLGGSLGACSPRVHTRGNLPDPAKVAEMKAGDITKDEVGEILGSPSTIADFGGDVWFYISEKTETLAWFRPVVTERTVLVMRFDKEGVLSKKMQVGVDAQNKITPIDRTTPTFGNELTFLEQIIGNVRRFSGKE